MRRVHFWQNCIARLLRVGQAANLRLFAGGFMASRFRVTSSIPKSQPARSPATPEQSIGKSWRCSLADPLCYRAGTSGLGFL
jgi:hypothetical protein